MDKYTVFCFALIFYSNSTIAFSQDTAENYGKYEIGLNITGALAGFLNANNATESFDPYLLSVKKINRKNILRLGLAGSRRSDSETDPTTLIRRTTNVSVTRMRLGFERRILISSKFISHWGIDAIGEYIWSDISTSGFTGQINLKQTGVGVGLGPVFGMHYILHPRVTLSTEASFYAVNRFITEKQNIPPELPVTLKNKYFRLLPIIPSSIYLNFRF